MSERNKRLVYAKQESLLVALTVGAQLLADFDLIRTSNNADFDVLWQTHATSGIAHSHANALVMRHMANLAQLLDERQSSWICALQCVVASVMSSIEASTKVELPYVPCEGLSRCHRHRTRLLFCEV